MKFKHVVRVRPAVIVAAATVVLAAAASPAFAQVHSTVEPPVADSKPRGERIAGVARRAEQFRGRYQLRLSEALTKNKANNRRPNDGRLLSKETR